MIWLLKDFDLLSVLLRGVTLGLEAVTLGGLAFLLCVAGPAVSVSQTETSRVLLGRLRRAGSMAALGLCLAQVAATGLSVAMLVGGSGLPWRSVVSADFLRAGVSLVGCSLAVCLLLRSRWPVGWCAPFACGLLAASLAMSHAASRLEGRGLLMALTAAHHLGTAGWIGAMVFLLLALRQADADPELAQRMARRYSVQAMVSVGLLVVAGVGLSYFYIGSWAGLYGNSYGVMVMAKSYLLLAMLLLGASNQRLLRGTGSAGLLARLRRFSEAEIGLGFTALLAAASLTSQAPAVDMPQDRLAGHEIVERLRWQAPRMSSPPVAALATPTSLQAALPHEQYGSGTVNDANDRAWSEYNHHWAGLIVLAAGVLALLARVLAGKPGWETVRGWAQAWPLLFLGLAVFVLLRADPENWPLGPRPFWASFSRPDVLEHRLYAVLITGFAFFEWAVERRWLHWRGAAYFFPAVCAIGGAVLLTHAHGLGNAREEMLAELSHTPIALLGATAGWGRWLEVRLRGDRAPARVASLVWPVCVALVGLVLLDYRET